MKLHQAGGNKDPNSVKILSRQQAGFYLASHQEYDKEVLKHIKKSSRQPKTPGHAYLPWSSWYDGV
jgi:hypothetical protein